MGRSNRIHKSISIQLDIVNVSYESFFKITGNFFPSCYCYSVGGTEQNLAAVRSNINHFPGQKHCRSVTFRRCTYTIWLYDAQIWCRLFLLMYWSPSHANAVEAHIVGGLQSNWIKSNSKQLRRSVYLRTLFARWICQHNEHALNKRVNNANRIIMETEKYIHSHILNLVCVVGCKHIHP